MPRVGANNVDLASSLNDFAVLTDSFDAGADLHRGVLLIFKLLDLGSPTVYGLQGKVHKAQFRQISCEL